MSSRTSRDIKNLTGSKDVKRLFLSFLIISSQLNAFIDINDKQIDKQFLFFGACKQGNAELMKLY